MKVKNGFRYDLNGWNYIHIEGKAHERGIAHGKLLKKEIKRSLEVMKWSLYDSYGIELEFFVDLSNELIKNKTEQNFPEFFDELVGISKGANVDLDELILWNNLFALDYIFPKISTYLTENTLLKNKYGYLFEQVSQIGGKINMSGANEKCSAFMAVGDYTHDRKICCAHNSFDNFIHGQSFNVVIDIKPDKGNRILFQAAPGYICSGTDVFVNDKGFIGTETTIGGFMKYVNKDPITCRIRNCMQYAQTLQDYVDMLTKENSGDYANSWLIGDTRRNEIMRIELGLDFVNVEKLKNGYFIGFNAPYHPGLRNIECRNTGFDDIRRHQGARKVRLEQLMEKHKGKINVDVAKAIIADHYDVYLNKTNPCSRTCCSHYELDDRAFMSQSDRPLPYQPRGAVDGFVIDTNSCKQMAFYGRWGTSCGTPFIVDAFIKQNIQWKRFGPWLIDRPSQPWTYISVLNSLKSKSSSYSTKKHKNKRRKLNITSKH